MFACTLSKGFDSVPTLTDIKTQKNVTFYDDLSISRLIILVQLVPSTYYENDDRATVDSHTVCLDEYCDTFDQFGLVLL